MDDNAVIAVTAQTDAQALAKGAFLAHVRNAIAADTARLEQLGAGVGGAIERSIVTALEHFLIEAPTGALIRMNEAIEDRLAQRQAVQDAVNAAHPADGSILPETSSPEPVPPPPADLETGVPGYPSAEDPVSAPSSAPVGGSDAPSEAAQLSPDPTDTPEGASSAEPDPESNL